MIAGAAYSILNSANSRESVTESCVCCRENSESNEEAQSCQWILRKPAYQRVLIRQYTSSPGEKMSEFVRKEGVVYVGLEMAEAAHLIFPNHLPCHYVEEMTDSL